MFIFEPMKILRGLYTLYGLLVFYILFLLFFFPLLIPILFPNQHKLVGLFNRWWAKLIFTLLLIPYSVKMYSKLDRKKQYIFCPNHFSYLDIPVMGLNPVNTIFVGKNDIPNVPLFTYMYRRLHITLDRNKLKSRYSSMVQTLEALDEGKSLVIFPEGGIVTEHDPVMGNYKNGAFRASIEKQIPIVPVTIPYNWIILPANQFLLTWRPIKIIFHEPIDPAGYTTKDIESYKMKVRSVIEAELAKELKYENRSAIVG
jgi:1-acyl-sn-glycerol-3-phosphate acyltransferase